MKLDNLVIVVLAKSLANDFINGVLNCCIGEKSDLDDIADAPWAISRHDLSSATAFGRGYTFFFYTDEVQPAKLMHLRDVFERRNIMFEEGGAELLDVELPKGRILLISDPADTSIIASAIRAASPSP